MRRKKNDDCTVPPGSMAEGTSEATTTYTAMGLSLAKKARHADKLLPIALQRKRGLRGVSARRGSPQALLQAIKASPHLTGADVDELIQAIGCKSEGQFANPLL